MTTRRRPLRLGSVATSGLPLDLLDAQSPKQVVANAQGVRHRNPINVSIFLVLPEYVGLNTVGFVTSRWRVRPSHGSPRAYTVWALP